MVNQNIFGIMPFKKKDFGMSNDPKMKKFDGSLSKINSMAGISRRESSMTLNSTVSRKKFNFSRSSQLEVANLDGNEKKRAEFIKRLEFDEFLNKFEYKRFNTCFLNQLKINKFFAEYQLAKEEKSKKKNKKDEKTKKRKVKVKQIENGITDIKGQVEKIHKFDNETETTTYCLWSAMDIFPILIHEENYEHNNKIIEKLSNLDVIIWETG